jgi:hypothetical protein
MRSVTPPVNVAVTVNNTLVPPVVLNRALNDTAREVMEDAGARLQDSFEAISRAAFASPASVFLGTPAVNDPEELRRRAGLLRDVATGRPRETATAVYSREVSQYQSDPLRSHRHELLEGNWDREADYLRSTSLGGDERTIIEMLKPQIRAEIIKGVKRYLKETVDIKIELVKEDTNLAIQVSLVDKESGEEIIKADSFVDLEY